MAILPVRDLASLGVITDVHPYDLPLNAFSYASNVRFENGKARRGPVARLVEDALPVYPTHAAGYRTGEANADAIFIGGSNGTAWRLQGGSVTNVTPPGRLVAESLEPWSDTFLGDVFYMNRPSSAPMAMLPGGARMVDLTGWGADWRCGSLRAFKDFLFAINLTRGQDSFPTSFRWSDATLAGQTPRSWDAADLSTLANEVLLAQLDSPLVDAIPLRNSLMLYSKTQIYIVDYTGDTSNAGQNLFVNRMVSADGGMIALNCAVEIEGKHYVFGVNDLYITDGNQRLSLGAAKIREWVFRNMDYGKADRCFVTHMPRFNEVLFGFVSLDDRAHFKDTDHCNRGILFNYVSGSMAIVDLPNVSKGTNVDMMTGKTWDEMGTTTWDGMGGSWQDLQSGSSFNPVFAAVAHDGGAAAHRLVALDNIDTGRIGLPYDPETTAPAIAERVGIDLDNAGSDLATYKVVRSMFPQVTMRTPGRFQIQVGGALYPSSPVLWDQPVGFNPETSYKIDMRVGGRYLAVRFLETAPADFDLSGFDLDVISGGRR